MVLKVRHNYHSSMVPRVNVMLALSQERFRIVFLFSITVQCQELGIWYHHELRSKQIEREEVKRQLARTVT